LLHKPKHGAELYTVHGPDHTKVVRALLNHIRFHGIHRFREIVRIIGGQ